MSLRAELRQLTALAVPVAVGQLGTMLLHAVDTLVLGRYGVRELAAATLGSQWVFFTLTIGLGVVSGIDPLVAQRHGAGDGPGTARALHQGLALALLCSLVISVAWLFTEDLLLALGQTPELAHMAHEFTLWQLPSVLPFLGWVALRSYLQGRGLVAPAMWVMLPVNLLNLLLNWVLVFGNLGAPELGLVGSALATSSSRLGGGLLLWAWVTRAGLHRGAWERPRLTSLTPAALAEPLRLGLPIGAQMALEVGAFALTALVAGRLGEAALAAHSIVLAVASLLFMVPLGIAIGTTTRVGNLLGAGRLSALRPALAAAAALGGAAAAANATLLLVGGAALAAFYTEVPEVRLLATSAFVVCAAFQLSDTAQVVAGGALRGMGLTRPPAVATFVGYYVFGIPFGYWLGAVRGQGLSGLWWGLALGLTVVGAGLSGWLRLAVRDRETAAVSLTSG